MSRWLSFISHTIDSFTCCPLDQVFVYKLVPPPLSHRYVEEESSFLRNKSCELARYISTQYFIVCFCLRLFSGSPSASHESLKSFTSPSLARKPVTACDYRLFLGSFTFLWLWRINVVCKSIQAILFMYLNSSPGSLDRPALICVDASHSSCAASYQCKNVTALWHFKLTSFFLWRSFVCLMYFFKLHPTDPPWRTSRRSSLLCASMRRNKTRIAHFTAPPPSHNYLLMCTMITRAQWLPSASCSQSIAEVEGGGRGIESFVIVERRSLRLILMLYLLIKALYWRQVVVKQQVSVDLPQTIPSLNCLRL